MAALVREDALPLALRQPLGQVYARAEHSEREGRAEAGGGERAVRAAFRAAQAQREPYISRRRPGEQRRRADEPYERERAAEREGRLRRRGRALRRDVRRRREGEYLPRRYRAERRAARYHRLAYARRGGGQERERALHRHGAEQAEESRGPERVRILPRRALQEEAREQYDGNHRRAREAQLQHGVEGRFYPFRHVSRPPSQVLSLIRRP